MYYPVCGSWMNKKPTLVVLRGRCAVESASTLATAVLLSVGGE